jgi:Dehydrogenases with different specificities (related to short-chain alcohol dehydrogenases)
MVNFSLEGQVALVTGAAYGIGFAMAQGLAEAGAKIAFNCRSKEHMDKALADYKALGIDAKGYLCDVTNEEDVNAMVADIEKTLGVIDILGQQMRAIIQAYPESWT